MRMTFWWPPCLMRLPISAADQNVEPVLLCLHLCARAGQRISNQQQSGADSCACCAARSLHQAQDCRRAHTVSLTLATRLGFATLGASLTADALSTQKGLAYPGFVEMNPIARPFVQSRAGAAVYNAGSFGLMAGLMYWAHKKEHHKLERILPFAVGSWEGLLSMRNYHVIANRPR